MDYNKIAIIHLNQIGDLLFSLPLLKSLRDNYPNARIHSILKPNLKDLLHDSPYVDEIIFREKNFVDTWTLLKTVRSQRYDVVLSLSRSETCLGLTALSGAPVKAGFAHFPWDFSLTVKETVEGHNSWYNNRKLLNRLDITVTKNDYVGLLRFTADSPGLTLPEKYVVISPGASRRRLMKAWSHEKFAELIILLRKHYHLTPVIIGGRDNHDYNEKIIAAVRSKDTSTHNSFFNLTEASLRSLSLIIKEAQLFVGIDSGFMHIASSLDVPLVGLFGPTDPQYVGPQNKKSIVVREASLKCVPCYLKPCEHRECMTKLAVRTVFEACEQLLTKTSC
jgi:ADP-heptose:LPS heptosyltransferase